MRIQLACCVVVLSSAAALADSKPADPCQRLKDAFGRRLTVLSCFKSADLTTNNEATKRAIAFGDTKQAA